MPTQEEQALTLDAASYRMDIAAPYMALARAGCKIVWEPAVPIAAADKWWRIYINPERFASLPVEQQALVLWHEVSHPLRDHMGRCEQAGAQPQLWNIAADMELHSKTSLPDGLVIVPGGVRPADRKYPEGLLAEDYYALLLADPNVQVVQVCAGSGSDGQSRPWELAPNDPSAPGLEGAEAHATRTLVAQAAKEAAARGEAPAGMDVWADSILHPVVPWRNLLRNAFLGAARGVGLGARTYNRVRQRGSMMFPRYAKPLPSVALVVDCSGSMGQDPTSPLARALTEVRALIRTYGPCDIVWVDAGATVQRHASPKDLKPKGGGGTDVGVGIAAACGLKPAPTCIITITDGETPWPAQPPIPHITVLVGDGVGPPWGKVVTYK